MRILFVDPGVNSAGIALFDNDMLCFSQTVTAKKAKANQFIDMTENIRQLLTAPVDLIIYEEPNLSGRFLSRSQRTMDRFIGSLLYMLRTNFGCSSAVGIHPMTLKAFYGSVKTDKFDMALKCGEFLPVNAQDALAAAIENEEFDVTDALALAGMHFEQQREYEFRER